MKKKHSKISLTGLSKKISSAYSKNKVIFIIFICIFTLHILLRFWDIDGRNIVANDQLDNAWTVKSILIDHKYPLVGMQAKGSSGFFIGPYYYYLITPIYFLTNLDPVASGIIAGLTSIFTFLVIFYVIRKIFTTRAALFGVFIYTTSYYLLAADRVQWPVNFILPLSFLILFSYYKIITSKPRYFLLAAFALGFSLHIHFTSIFYFVLFVLILPFIPRTKETIKYVLYSIPIVMFFIAPILISTFTNNANTGKHLTSYMGENYHGLHLRRVMQLFSDAFIQFESIAHFKYLKYFSWLLLPFFGIIFYLDKNQKSQRVLLYLCAIWIIVPWIAFSTYKGEISNYYFNMTIPVVLLCISYLLARLYGIGNRLIRIALFCVLIAFSISNIIPYFSANRVGLYIQRERVKLAVKKHERIPFSQWGADSYLYYVHVERYLTKKH